MGSLTRVNALDSVAELGQEFSLAINRGKTWSLVQTGDTKTFSALSLQ